MDIALHIGAHKTGSTFLQGALARNADTLAAHGVRFVPHRDLRQNLTARLGRGGDRRHAAKLKAAGAFLAGELAQGGIRRLVLSEENFLGGPERLEARRALYDDPGRKLAELARMLAGHRVTLFLSVRTLVPFLSALLVECFRTGRYRPEIPDGYLADWMAAPRGWADLVHDLAGLFPQAGIVVWDHGDLFGNEAALLRRLTGLPPEVPLTTDGVARRPSPSGRAMQAFLGAPDSGDPAARVAALAAAVAAWPRAPDRPVFRLGTAADMALSRARFRDDLAAIAAIGPPVTLLRAADLSCSAPRSACG